MNSLVYLSTPNLLSCKGQEYLETILPNIIAQLQKDGYCVVQMWDLTEIPLIKLRDCLGRGQLHIHADQNGLVTISPNASPIVQSNESHYFGGTSRKHPPHTDGAYLNGFLGKNGVFKRVGPPAVVMIQCVRPALQGGTNIVIDAQAILKDLLTQQPEIAHILLTPGCISFCRDDQMAVDLSVYERLPTDRWRVRFRCDNALYIADWARNAVQHLYEHYLAHETYQTRIDLQEGQILLLDNFRVLHGRENFSVTVENNRFFRRAWIHDDSEPSGFSNFCNAPKHCPAFERYAFYGLTPQSTVQFQLPLTPGIKLSQRLQAIASKQAPLSLPQAA